MSGGLISVHKATVERTASFRESNIHISERRLDGSCLVATVGDEKDKCTWLSASIHYRETWSVPARDRAAAAHRPPVQSARCLGNASASSLIVDTGASFVLSAVRPPTPSSTSPPTYRNAAAFIKPPGPSVAVPDGLTALDVVASAREATAAPPPH